MPDAKKEALLRQLNKLEATQWWTTEKTHQHQMQRVSTLVAHAYRTTAFYRQRLEAAGYRPGTPIDHNRFAELPVITRADIQAAEETIFSHQVPRNHGRVLIGKTTG